jgi:hypothetical protein
MNIKDYTEQLRNGGHRVVAGSENTLWLSHEHFSMLRQPTFASHMPGPEEISSVFRKSRAAILSFIVSPSSEHVANSCLYLCTDPEYSLAKLGRGARYDTNRGLNEFEIRPLDLAEILRLGGPAYRDTLQRTGLSIEHRERFEDAFRRSRSERVYIGAMKGDRLAAFLVLRAVDDWVSIGGYSANEFLPLRPNNALIYHVTHDYLVQKKFRVVDYGLSSIQAVSHAEGLNSFKVKMGFPSTPVHRAFVLNPLLRPFANRFSWGLVNRMLRFSPQHPLLKKAEGALRLTLSRYA